MVPNTIKGHSQTDTCGFLRSDVLFKTIVRDMRKFYTHELNDATKYIKRKRYRTPEFYFECLNEYLGAKFSEYESLVLGFRSIKYSESNTINE